ncbi:MAG: tandem-95 repeat protein, partial [Candidatus Latescibacteria bacterium]|nr:tandem-95 repeat protein [Candidatus Latescibacterota bacterium]
APAMVRVTVTPVNDVPVAANGSIRTDEDVTVSGQVVASDVDNVSLSYAVARGPAHGALSLGANGAYTYTPAANYYGSDSFTFRANDGVADSNEGTVEISVTPVNDPPVAEGGALQIAEDTASSGQLSASDLDDTALSYSVAANAAQGQVVIDGTGQYTYTPGLNFFGADQFTVVVSDGKSYSAPAMVRVTVTPVNDAPVAANGSIGTDEDVAVSGQVVAGDVDNVSLSYAVARGPAHGEVSLGANGAYTYTPAANYYGADSFTFRANDGSSDSNEGTVEISVTPVNDPPVAAGGSVQLPEDTAVSGQVVASDLDDTALSYSVAANAAQGQVVIDGAGRYTYTPALNFYGIDQFTVVVSDGKSYSAPATVVVTVTPVNDAPVAANGSIQADEDVAVSGQVVAGDVDNVSLSYAVARGPAHGVLSLGASGAYTYTPAPNYNGADSFTFRANDGVAGSNEGTVTLTVNPVTDAPVAAADAATTAEETPVVVDVLVNDEDEDRDVLSLTAVGYTGQGSVTFAANGAVRYEPARDFTGVESLSYTVSDGNGGLATGLLTLTVSNVNDPLVASDDIAETSEDQAVAVAVLVNDVDVDGDALRVLSVSDGASGTTAVDANGVVTYTPAPNSNGRDRFTYEVTDGEGSQATGTVSVTVNPVTDAPVAAGDAVTTAEDVVLAGTLAASDVDGTSLGYEVVDAPAHGQLVPGNAGAYTYTPEPNYHGADRFTFRASDGLLVSAPATVEITVTPVNDVPVATADVATTAEDLPVSVAVLANDTDVDQDHLRVQSVGPAGKGQTALAEDGTVTYTPAANTNGEDSFTYTLVDGEGSQASATVIVRVTPVNDAPVALDAAASTAEDTPLAGALRASDVDSEALNYLVATAPVHGTVVLDGAGYLYTPEPNYYGPDRFTFRASDGAADSNLGAVELAVTPVNDAPVAAADAVTTAEDRPLSVAVLGNDLDVDNDALAVTVNQDGQHGHAVADTNNTLTYTPAADFNGADSFSYTVSDGQGGSAAAIVTVMVSPVNDAPVAAADLVSTGEDLAVTVEVLVNDRDVDGDELTISAVSQGSAGGQASFSGQVLSYTPAPNYHGPETFTYTVSDGQGGTASATLSATVVPVNDAPVAGDDLAGTAEGVPVTIEVLANDTDVDGDLLTVGITSLAAHGTLQLGTAAAVIYTPAANYHGPDRFTYTVSDGQGGSAIATVTIAVTPVNDAPVAVDGAAETAEEVAVTGVLAASDVDGDPLTYSVATGPVHGAVAVNGSAYTYTPAPDYHGPDSFTFRAKDGSVYSSPAAVVIVVAPVNDAPVAVDDAITTTEDTPVAVAVLANDRDVDGNILAVSALGAAAHGTAALGGDGRVSYRPAADFNGPDSFTYTVSDGSGGSATGTVTVTVTPVNDAPVAVADAITTDEDTRGQVDVLANDRDVDGNPLTAYGLVQGQRGTAVLGSGGELWYTPNPNFNGADTLRYTAADGQGGSDAGEVVVKVRAVNDAPVATDDLASLPEDTPFSLSPLGNDLDADGDVLALTGVGQGLHGTVALGASGSVLYTPAADFNGSDSFTYTISDAKGGADTGTVNLRVTPVNDVPVANAGPVQTVDEGAAVSLTGSASDVDGGSLQFQWTQVGGPVVSLSGAATATPSFTAPPVTGTTALSFRLVVTDQGGLASEPAFTTVSVRDRNNAANWLFLGVHSGAAAIQSRLRNEDLIRFSRDAQGKVIPETVERFFDGSQFFKSDEALDAVEVDNFDGDAELEVVFSVRSKANIKMEGLEIKPGDLVLYNPSSTTRFRILLAGSALFRDYQGKFARNRENIDGVAIQQLSPTLWKVFLTTTSDEQIGSLGFDHNDVVQVDFNPVTRAVSNPVKVLDSGSLFRGKDADLDGLEVADEDGNGTVESIVFSTSSAERLKDGRAVLASVLYVYNQELKTTEELFDLVADGLSRGRPGLSNVAALGSLKPWGTGPKPLRLAKEAVAEVLPGEFALEPNYPNPFNPATTIGYRLGEVTAVRLAVYDVLGQQIKVLVDQAQVPGSYEVQWEGIDEGGKAVGSGIYFYRLEAGPRVATGKMLLVR